MRRAPRSHFSASAGRPDSRASWPRPQGGLVAGVVTQHPFEDLLGSLRPAEHVFAAGQMDQHVGIARPACQRLLQQRQGFVVTTAVDQATRQLPASVVTLRVDLQHQAVIGDSPVRHLDMPPEIAAQVQRLRVVGIHRSPTIQEAQRVENAVQPSVALDERLPDQDGVGGTFLARIST